MRNRIVLISLLITASLNGYSQIEFEKGYFIDNTGQKTECLIKNMEWKNNPKGFIYKLTEDSEPVKGSLTSVSEFGLENVKYERHVVDIDMSNDKLSQHLSETRNPEFVKDTLFLEVMIEGKASLYYYTNGGIIRFFYSKDGLDIEQLVRKIYLISQIKQGVNNQFRQQLLLVLDCNTISTNDLERLNYDKKDLADIFIKYNNCEGNNYIRYHKKKKAKVNLSIKPGIRFSKYKITDRVKTDFESQQNMVVGINLEFILPFNKGRWSIFTEPTYQYYNSETVVTIISANNISFEIPVSVEYKSIEVPLGLRFYIFLNKTNKLFINAAFIVDFPFESSLVKYENIEAIDISIAQNIALSAGYYFKNKISLEFSYGFSRNLINQQSNWNSSYTYYSIMLGYNFL